MEDLHQAKVRSGVARLPQPALPMSEPSQRFHRHSSLEQEECQDWEGEGSLYCAAASFRSWFSPPARQLHNLKDLRGFMDFPPLPPGLKRGANEPAAPGDDGQALRHCVNCAFT